MNDHKIWWMFDNHTFMDVEALGDVDRIKDRLRCVIDSGDCGGLFTHDPRIQGGPQRNYREPFEAFWTRAEPWLRKAMQLHGADRQFQDYAGD